MNRRTDAVANAPTNLFGASRIMARLGLSAPCRWFSKPLRLPISSTPIRRIVLLPAVGLTFLALAALSGPARCQQDTSSNSPQNAASSSQRPALSTDLPCLLAPEGKGVLVLFSGSPDELTANFVQKDGTAPTWQVTGEGALLARDSDLMTRQQFGDMQLHIEFKVPAMPNATGQGRGNSGILLHGRFEIQILDSFGVQNVGSGDCGAVYNTQAPLANACKAPNEWQSYDIIFKAPVFDSDGHTRLQKATVTVFLNGFLVQNNTEIPGATGPDKIGDATRPAPLLLQYHGSPVEFRNIWALPLSPTTTQRDAPRQVDGVYSWQDPPKGMEVPVQKVLFDKSGYQIVCESGAVITVPFTNQNLNTMKFGRAEGGQTYFVNEGDAPVLYLRNGDGLANAVVQDAVWYPLPTDYQINHPIYVSLAPTWRDYVTMGWYPGMAIYGGGVYYRSGALPAWIPGSYINVNRTRLPSFGVYRNYLTTNRNFIQNRSIFNNYSIRNVWRGGRGVAIGRRR